MRNISNKRCRENQHTHFMFNNFLSKVTFFNNPHILSFIKIRPIGAELFHLNGQTWRTNCRVSQFLRTRLKHGVIVVGFLISAPARTKQFHLFIWNYHKLKGRIHVLRACLSASPLNLAQAWGSTVNTGYNEFSPHRRTLLHCCAVFFVLTSRGFLPTAASFCILFFLAGWFFICSLCCLLTLLVYFFSNSFWKGLEARILLLALPSLLSEVSLWCLPSDRADIFFNLLPCCGLCLLTACECQ
jgi:hypothetical protein